MAYITPIPSPWNDWMGWNQGWKPNVWHGMTASEIGYLNSHLRYLSGFTTTPGWTRFEAVTRNAVIAYQQWWGLTVDGWVGPQTWGVLDYHTTL